MMGYVRRRYLPERYIQGKEAAVSYRQREYTKCRSAENQYSLSALVLLFFTFSVIGWLWEVAYHLWEDGMFINRGFLMGPWLPIYGTGGILILVMLKKYFDRPLVLFFLIMGICGTVEYVTGWFLETVFHEKWWDYSEYTFQIQGRVCLIGLLIFGLGGLAFVYGIAPLLNQKIENMNSHVRNLLCIAFLAIFILDVLYSFGHPNLGAGITHPVQLILPGSGPGGHAGMNIWRLP